MALCARQAGIDGLSLYDCLWEHLLALSLEDLGRVRRFVLEHWAAREPPVHTWVVLLYDVVQVRPLLRPDGLPPPSTPCIGTPTALLGWGGATLLSQAACRPPSMPCMVTNASPLFVVMQGVRSCWPKLPAFHPAARGVCLPVVLVFALLAVLCPFPRACGGAWRYTNRCISHTARPEAFWLPQLDILSSVSHT